MRQTKHHADQRAAASVSVRGINKRYADTQALDNVSFDVEPGELFGLIGSDGAGKSTLLRILVTVVLPDSGTALLDGLDVVKDYRKVRQSVGYMPGKFSLYQDLTIRENLEFFASVFGTKIEDEYDFIAPIYSQIEPFNKRKAGDLSGGMKQKLALCCALVHRPRVLILDEPTTGVDAVSRAEFWDMLKELREQGITTIVSTPYMDEAARCDRIALIQEGRLLRQADRPEDVAKSFPFPLVQLRAAGPRPKLLAALRDAPFIERADVFGEWIHVSGKPATRQDDLISALRQNVASGFQDFHVEGIDPSVEDVFMTLMDDPNSALQLAKSETAPKPAEPLLQSKSELRRL